MTEMSESTARSGTAADGDEFTAESGYDPKFKRSLGGFQVFAISFAFISVAVGIFGTYDDVLTTAGPVGIWLWIIAVDRADPGGSGLRPVRGADPAQRIGLPVGVPTGEPEDRLGLRLARRLDAGDRRRGDRQRAGQSGPDAAAGSAE